MFVIEKRFDEGTAGPFMARMLAGILTMRDQFVNCRSSADTDTIMARDKFDLLYKPVLESMFTIRKVAADIVRTIIDHRGKLQSAEIVRLQPNAIEIRESITDTLQAEILRLLNSAARAVRYTQKVTTYVGVDISALFAKQNNFERRLNQLESEGAHDLVEYLRAVRSNWSEELFVLRNDAEHNGWTLERPNYRRDNNDVVTMTEPHINSQPVSQWVKDMEANVLAFIEEVLVHSFQGALTLGMTIVEIPEMERDRDKPMRFKLSHPAIERLTPWKIKYKPEGFH